MSDEPESIPERRYMISSAVFIGNTPEEVAARLPSDKNMRIIGTVEARQLFGAEAERMDGVTVRSYLTLTCTLIDQECSGWRMTLSNCTSGPKCVSSLH